MLRAELSAIKAQEPAKYEFQADDGSWHQFLSEQHYKNTLADGWTIRALYAAPVSEAKAQGVVMPERKTKADYGVYIDEFADEAAAIYNAALDAVARLNAAPVQWVSVQGGLELIKRMQVCLSLDDTEWGLSAPEKYKLLGDIKSYVLAANSAESTAPGGDQ